MRSGDPYRDTARELLERAGNHPNAQQRAKLETTAAEWLRLADEADRATALRSILNCPRVSKKKRLGRVPPKGQRRGPRDSRRVRCRLGRGATAVTELICADPHSSMNSQVFE